jgi:hypothetical protein
MKRLFPLVILTSVCLTGFSQNGDDALRYTETFAGGTARYVSMGGAFGALGADFSATSQNPAGLGFYRRSEFTVSPEFYYQKVKSTYFGDKAEDTKFNINTNNLGFVFSFNDKKKEKGLIGWSLGLGFNKINNFNSNSIASGVNSHSSLADEFAWNANNGGLERYTSDLFYNAYILDQDTVTNEYYVNPDMLLPGIQRKTVSKTGKMNEWQLGAGFNISNIVYFGLSLNMIPVYYNESSTLSEYDSADYSYLYFSYHEGRKTSGVGYGAKLGIIVRPVSMLRIGVAFHTPVVYNLTQKDEVYVDTYYPDGYFTTYYPLADDGYDIYELKSDYNVETPAKLVGSIAATIGDMAVISTDIEYINYASMRLRDGSDGYDFATENQDITDIYRNNINLKLGAEFRFEPFYVRGGFGYYGSPYVKNELNEDAYSLMYGGGFGFRDKNFFIDLAVSNLSRKESILFYSSVEDETKYTSNTTRITTTIGFRF